LLPVELDQQLARFDVVAFLDRQPDDLRADIGTDVDLGVRLDLAGTVDLLHDLRALDRSQLDLLRLVVLAAHQGEAAGAECDQHGDDDDDEIAFFHGPFPRSFRRWAHGPRTPAGGGVPKVMTTSGTGSWQRETATPATMRKRCANP